MIIEIRPIEKKRWHNLPKDRSISQPLTFTTAIDPALMQYKVAISAKELEEIQKRTGYDLSLTVKPNQPHPFWDSPMMKVKLSRDETTVMNIKSDVDTLKLAIIKGSGLVAHSFQDIENNHRAEFFIFSEDEEVHRNEAKATTTMNAIAKLDKLTDAQKKSLLRLLSNKRVGDRSGNFINTMLFDIISKDAVAFLDYASMTPTRLKSLVIIEEAVSDGHLQKEGTSYFYASERIGFDRKEAAEFLEQPKNQPMRLRLMELCNIE
jgi:hypothetical protein